MPATQLPKLDGWKEIAAYLGRDVTTAIRWEGERRLPVHRVPGGKRSAVYAYPHEIDEWLNGGSEPDPDRLRATGDKVGAAAGGLAATASPLAQESRATPSRRRAVIWAAVIAAVIVVVLVVEAMQRGSDALRPRAAKSGVTPARGLVASVEFRRSEIAALDAEGRELWRHSSDAQIDEKGMAMRPSPRYAITDLDGDGTSEIVASIVRWVTPGAKQDELLCFSREGRVLWRLQLDDVISFRGGTFGPPWAEGHVVAYHVDGETRIAWSQNSAPFWPSVLTVLDADGRRLSKFVHSGSIYALAAFEGSEGPLILGGVVSNSNRAAGLFVLDGRAATGHSSEPAGSAYECLGCPPGQPLRYFLFPPSEITVARGRPYNTPLGISGARESFEVATIELDDDSSQAQLRFTFSHEFDLLRAHPDDGSWPAHEQLERVGKLDHSVASCPMFRVPPPVRAWDAVNGWRDLKPVAGALVTVGPRPNGRPVGTP